MAVAPHCYEEKDILGKTWVESQPVNEKLNKVLHQPGHCSHPVTFCPKEAVFCAVPLSRPERGGIRGFPQLSGETKSGSHLRKGGHQCSGLRCKSARKPQGQDSPHRVSIDSSL